MSTKKGLIFSLSTVATLFLSAYLTTQLLSSQQTVEITNSFSTTDEKPDKLGEEGEREGIGKAQRWLRMVRFGKDSLTKEDMKAQLRAHQAYRQHRAKKKGKAGNLKWNNIGPNNYGGRTRAILVDQNNPNRVFAGGVAGGLWVSHNKGQSWERVKGFTGYYTISAITQGADGDIYIGTGEGFAGAGAPNSLGDTRWNSGHIGNGIWKSTTLTSDTAVFEHLSSTDVSNNTRWRYIYDVQAHPNQSNLIYASTHSGLMASTDGGQSWSMVTTTDVNDFGRSSDIEIGPNGVAYAAVGGEYIKSLSGNPGDFVKKTDVLSNYNAGSVERLEFSVAPSDPGYVYLTTIGYPSCITGTNRACLYNIYRSTDQGESWSIIGPRCASNFEPYGTLSGGERVHCQGRYDSKIAVAPDDKDKIFLGGQLYLYQWTQSNGWERIARSGGFIPVENRVHVDYHEITFSPSDPKRMYVGCDGGIYTSKDQGETFQRLNKGYITTQFYGLGVARDGRVGGGTQDNGAHYLDYVSQNNAYSSNQITGGDAGYMQFSDIEPTFIATSIQDRPLFSFSKGNNFGGITGQIDSDGDGVPDNVGFMDFVLPFKMWDSPRDTIRDSIFNVSVKANQRPNVPSEYIIDIVYNPNAPGTDTLYLYKEPKYLTLKGENYYIKNFFMIGTNDFWLTNQMLTGGTEWYEIDQPNGNVRGFAVSSTGDTIYLNTSGGRVYRYTGMRSVPYGQYFNCGIDTADQNYKPSGCEFDVSQTRTAHLTIDTTVFSQANGIDKSGNGYVVTGHTKKAGNGTHDVYLARFDNKNEISWAKTYGSNSNDEYGVDVQKTSNGYIIAGYTASFGGGGNDVYVVKTNNNGNLMWSKTYGGASNDQGFAVKTLPGNNYLIAGRTNSFGHGGYDGLLLKIKETSSTTSQLKWSHAYGDVNDDEFNGVTRSVNNDGYVATGSMNNSTNDDVYVVKTDKLGNIDWTRTISGNTSHQRGRSIIRTSDNDYLISAQYNRSGSNSDIGLIRMSDTGTVAWAKAYGGANNETLSRFSDGLKERGTGGFIIAGATNSFSSGSISGKSGYLVQTNRKGKEVWSQAYGGSNTDEFHDIELGGSNSNAFTLIGGTNSFGTNTDVYYINDRKHVGGSCSKYRFKPTTQTDTLSTGGTLTMGTPMPCDTTCKDIILDCAGGCNPGFTYTDSCETVNFFETATGPADTFVWMFGDGARDTGQSVTHTYASIDTFTPCVVAIDTGGAICDTFCQSIILDCGIDVACDAGFKHDDSCLTVDYTQASMGQLAQYVWQFGDGSQDTGLNVTHNYASVDTYNTCLIAYDTREIEGGSSYSAATSESSQTSNWRTLCQTGIFKQRTVISGWLTSVDVDPDNSDHVVVTKGGYGNNNFVYRSTDGGRTFNSIQGDLPQFPVYDVEIDARNSNHIYVATEFGVWMTDNPNGASTSWQEENGGKMDPVPTFHIEQKRIFNDNFKDSLAFFTSTHGRGFFTADFKPCPNDYPGARCIGVGIDEPDLTSSENGFLHIYPNPMRNEGFVEVELTSSTDVQIEIYNLQGGLMKRTVKSHQPAGQHKYTLDVSELKSGMYMIRAKANGNTRSGKMMIMK